MTLDQRAQVPFKGTFQGVSRQPPTSRSPFHFDELINMYPSVERSGSITRPGIGLKLWKTANDYSSAGKAHYFRTTDGQRWLLAQSNVAGSLRVFNADTGAEATVTTNAGATSYLSAGTGSNLRFLTLADTTFILNRDVVVSASESAATDLSAVYIVIRRVSSAEQQFKFTRSSGGTRTLGLGKDNTHTREYVANAFAISIMDLVNPLGCSVTTLAEASHIIKITGPTTELKQFQANNTWDESAVLTVKGTVGATSDLLVPFDHGAVVKVSSAKTSAADVSYYARYDRETNVWVETSYLGADQVTATFTANTMPITLKQTGTSTFELAPAPWLGRTRGDSKTNRLPYFVGKKIIDIASWKGRLILASDDMLNMSRADDVFNFWKETAREVRPADPIELPCDAPGLARVEHVTPFRNKLIVSSKAIQLEVPGDRPLTPETATVGVATKYAMSPDCQPTVVGDSMYFTGTIDGRSAMWEYAYNNDAANNTADDVSKHVPGYIKGKVKRIVGSVQSGRLFVTATGEPTTLYHHTSYWKDGQKVQSAWAKTTIPGITEIRDVWEDDGTVIVWAKMGSYLVLLMVSAETQDTTSETPFGDALYQVSGTFAAGYTSFTIPEPLRGNPVIRLFHSGAAWWTEKQGTEVSGSYRVPGDYTSNVCFLGIPITSTVVFSPFYWQDQNGPVSTGRWQVQKMAVDLEIVGDFTATISVRDRPDATAYRGSRTTGSDWSLTVPSAGQFQIPVNSEGRYAKVKLEATGTVPMLLTGYALSGRYTNTYQG